MPDTRTADVAVVGAGLAGLRAADLLARAGAEVVVLEARERPGGRVLTSRVGDTWIDEGGQWLGAGQTRIYGLVSELGLQTFPTYETGDYVAVIGGSRRRFSGRLPKLGLLTTADFAQGVLRYERLARGVSNEAPWRHPRAESMDSQTLESWARGTFLTPVGRRLFGLLASAVFAADPSEISLLFALAYTKAGTSFETLVSSAGGAQQDRVVGGTMQLAERLAERLAEAVVYESPVGEIDQTGKGSVKVRSDRLHVTCKRVVVALPPVLAWRIEYRPPLPQPKDRLLRSLLPGNAVKFHAVYPSPFWRSDGLCGQAGSPDLPVSFTFDNSPPDGSCGILVAFAEGRHAATLSRLDPPDRRTTVLGALREYFGPEASRPSEFLERDWGEEIWTRGCYAAHAPTGVLTRFGQELRSPHGAVHFAGSETATVWTGYMEGALESGERAATEVARELGLETD